MTDKQDPPGKANGKVADSAIQGTMGGRRNRASTDSGLIRRPLVRFVMQAANPVARQNQGLTIEYEHA